MHQLTRILSTAALCLTSFLTIAQAADKETVLYRFDHASGGSGPANGLYMDQSGNLFGLGLSGVFFELSPNGSGGWNYSELLASDCSYPTGPLVRDQAGNFYAANFFGTVYQFSPSSSGGWNESLVYDINNGVSGAGPSNLLVDAADNVYGTNGANGANGLGYVFQLSPNSSGGWSLTDLHDFNGTDGDASPSGMTASGILGGLTMDASGNLYGVTYAGGSNSTCGSKCGVVFRLTNKSGIWTETVLHTFNGTDGSGPDAAMLLDAAGNLFGTTTGGGASGFGVVFEISLVSGKPLTHVIHSFTNANGDGAYPQAALIMDASGNLYGSTTSGGESFNCSVEQDNGCGTVFKLSPIGKQWKESLLHAFKGNGDGGFPSGVVLGTNGNLYGDGFTGGIFSQGVVFEIKP